MTDTTSEPVRFMGQLISLDYTQRVSPTAQRFAVVLREGRIIGHRCPSCRRVYVPPRGFCPICTVATGETDEVDVADRGIVTSWTVLTPIQYHGQTERKDYALASILLDGADGTVGQQRLIDIELDEIVQGLKVEAVWAPAGERAGGVGGGGWLGFGEAITGWRATGEAPAPEAAYKDHVL